jgi:hypothetical protein
MAASHMQLVTGMQLTYVALQHRMLAIEGSNKAISRSIQTGSDGDALLASCYCLGFQSSYMIDGMQDCFRLLRGCKMLDLQLRTQSLPMAFFLPQVRHFDIMQPRLFDLPVIEPEILDRAGASLQLLLPHLHGPIHVALYHSLLEVIETLRFSSLKGTWPSNTSDTILILNSILQIPHLVPKYSKVRYRKLRTTHRSHQSYRSRPSDTLPCH